jgi:putative SOS response-associated peptidase YedK
MVGRYSLVTPVDALRAAFGFDTRPPALPARYNIAPTQIVPVVRRGSDGRRELAPMRWGFALSWNPRTAIMDAQAETVAGKKSFRDAYARRRALVPADGFYEWKTVGKTHQPWRYTVGEAEPFAFAGLWQRFTLGDRVMACCTILTTPANALCAAVHDRMPLILPPSAYAEWLGEAEADPAALMRPFPAERMRAQRIGSAINEAGREGPDLIRPLDAAPSG